FSSGSTGQALLQNHTVSSGMIINTDLILPANKKDSIEKIIGAAPAEAKNNIARHKWITDAFFKIGLGDDAPLVSAIWYSDPDGAAHSKGIGSPEAKESIRIVDEQFGRIIATLKEKNLLQLFNIIISADHGFVTYVGKESVSDFLIKSSLKAGAKSEDVVLAGGAIYVKDHDADKIQAIVSALQSQEWIGAIFTRGSKPGDMKGLVPGTLSFEAIHWDHPQRAGDILVDMNWNDNKNERGYAGSSFSKGVAGHGSLSKYEVHIALLASGPSFKKNYMSEVPTSNVDITPTILHLQHMPVPAGMDGRVMQELLTEQTNQAIPVVKEETIETSANYAGGKYSLFLKRSIVGKYNYVNYSLVKRNL
ncbi:MAG: alkaline phosphatase family protein, partial [Chitinophagaceae bacterium]